MLIILIPSVWVLTKSIHQSQVKWHESGGKEKDQVEHVAPQLILDAYPVFK